MASPTTTSSREATADSATTLANRASSLSASASSFYPNAVTTSATRARDLDRLSQEGATTLELASLVDSSTFLLVPLSGAFL